jgi:hypothetical protein
MNDNQQNPAIPPAAQQGPAVPPAPQPAPQAVPVAQDQWEVTYHWEDEASEPELFNRFANAFAFSQPNPDDDDYDWRYTRRAEIEARFAAGENNIRVAWSAHMAEQVYVTIRRL